MTVIEDGDTIALLISCSSLLLLCVCVRACVQSDFSSVVKRRRGMLSFGWKESYKGRGANWSTYSTPFQEKEGEREKEDKKKPIENWIIFGIEVKEWTKDAKLFDYGRTLGRHLLRHLQRLVLSIEKSCLRQPLQIHKAIDDISSVRIDINSSRTHLSSIYTWMNKIPYLSVVDSRM